MIKRVVANEIFVNIGLLTRAFFYTFVQFSYQRRKHFFSAVS